ncbi:transposase [Dissulfuribacter thermophilus]|uniref:Transposase n=1 Tax=Dissulfuribacter thermophilus TaxID=1156395 RepID=A0A1B9F6N1_9BACT|nr:transposase [Dissulfuribacter thermophilus]OCC15465.1 transposase [Dissulfuribacter thermophilus]
MPRIPRLLVQGEEAVYHVISRTALEGFVLAPEEKQYLLFLMQWLSRVFFVEVYGFCIMDNHFHMLVKIRPQDHYSDEDVLKRARLYYRYMETKKKVNIHEIDRFREKFSGLSEYVKEIKQRFSRYYNKKHGRRGYFWGERFKSVLVEEGESLLNCLAYIELNPVRAGIVERPEDYRWCSLGYHVQSGNRGGFLSTELCLKEFCNRRVSRDWLRLLREYVYEKGGLKNNKGQKLKKAILDEERKRRYRLPRHELFLKRIRYFTDSGILGSKAFVRRWYKEFRDYFTSKDKIPKKIPGIWGMYSLKRLSN